MFDFSNADEQREYVEGPVPSGSVVVVRLKVVMPDAEKQASDNHFISEAKSGLRQIYCQFDVDRGTYQGVSFRQNITLPAAAQKISLGPNQETACKIGASTLKAICQAANKPTAVANIEDISGYKFPVRVKIRNKTEYDKPDSPWRNEIAMVITPDKDEYKIVQRDGEIINANGAVTGKDKTGNNQVHRDPMPAYAGSEDDVPF